MSHDSAPEELERLVQVRRALGREEHHARDENRHGEAHECRARDRHRADKAQFEPHHKHDTEEVHLVPAPPVKDLQPVRRERNAELIGLFVEDGDAERAVVFYR